jgi:hypothetical protein
MRLFELFLATVLLGNLLSPNQLFYELVPILYNIGPTFLQKPPNIFKSVFSHTMAASAAPKNLDILA